VKTLGLLGCCQVSVVRPSVCGWCHLPSWFLLLGIACRQCVCVRESSYFGTLLKFFSSVAGLPCLFWAFPAPWAVFAGLSASSGSRSVSSVSQVVHIRVGPPVNVAWAVPYDDGLAVCLHASRIIVVSSPECVVALGDLFAPGKSLVCFYIGAQAAGCVVRFVGCVTSYSCFKQRWLGFRARQVSAAGRGFVVFFIARFRPLRRLLARSVFLVAVFCSLL